LVQLCFIKRNGQRKYKYLVLGRDRSYFFLNPKTPLLILPKSLLKLISSTCSSFDWQHICYVWWTYLSTDSRHYLWVQTVLLFSPTCSFTVWGIIHTRASQEKRKEAIRSFNFTFRYIDDVLSLNNSRLVNLLIRLSHWAWNKGHQRYR
jgi:hypothetical protein